MKKIIINAYRVLSVIASIYGLLMFIACIAKDEPVYAPAAIGIFFGGVFLWGLSYLVEAACIYINKNNNGL
jgi:RsiW-degrading membrane proteinase PrsW (M82 family)